MAEENNLKIDNKKLEDSLLGMVERERNASIRERQITQSAFLEAIEKQTQRQSESLSHLGDRFENSIIEMRKDMRSSSRQMIAVILISILVIASLAGVSVNYLYDGNTTKLDLNKQKIPISIKK